MKLGDFPRAIAGVLDYIGTHPSNANRSTSRTVLSGASSHVLQRLGCSPKIVSLGEKSKIRANYRYPSAMMCLYANPPDLGAWHVWRRHLVPGSLFIDVGANIGVYSILAAELGARVVSCEPNEGAAEELRANIELNHYVDEISVITKVIAATAGITAFTDDLDSMNHMVPLHHKNSLVTSFYEMTTLSELVESHHVSGLKVDVEGAELDVLIGGDAMLRAGRCDLLQLEWNDQSKKNYGIDRPEIADFLATHGYEIYRPTGNSGMLERTDSAIGDDVFAARPDAIQHLLRRTSRY